MSSRGLIHVLNSNLFFPQNSDLIHVLNSDTTSSCFDVFYENGRLMKIMSVYSRPFPEERLLPVVKDRVADRKGTCDMRNYHGIVVIKEPRLAIFPAQIIVCLQAFCDFFTLIYLCFIRY